MMMMMMLKWHSTLLKSDVVAGTTHTCTDMRHHTEAYDIQLPVLVKSY